MSLYFFLFYVLFSLCMQYTHIEDIRRDDKTVLADENKFIRSTRLVTFFYLSDSNTLMITTT